MIRLRRAIVLVVLCSWGTTFVPGCGKDKKSTDPGNHPPTILSLTAEPDTFVADHSSTITVVAEDPDGDDLHYTWETQGEGFEGLPSETSTLVVTNCCPVVETASVVVHAIVDDGRGGEDHDSIRVWAVPGGFRQ